MKLKINFLDTTIATSYRLREARENINNIALFNLIMFMIFFPFFPVCMLFNQIILGFVFFGFSIMYLVLLVALVIKREIYSLVIFIKDNIEEG